MIDDVHLVAIRSDNYKYLVDLRKPQKWQLYNLEKDPGENDDLNNGKPLDAPDFKEILDKHLAMVRSSKIDQTTPVPTDDQLAARLRELGYMD